MFQIFIVLIVVPQVRIELTRLSTTVFETVMATVTSLRRFSHFIFYFWLITIRKRFNDFSDCGTAAYFSYFYFVTLYFTPKHLAIQSRFNLEKCFLIFFICFHSVYLVTSAGLEPASLWTVVFIVELLHNTSLQQFPYILYHTYYKHLSL